MPFKRFAILMTAVAGLLLLTGKPAAAQITELRNYHGKKIYCTLSGLRGFSSECGISNDYEYIFIGSVLSVAQISDEERRLQLQPHEIFLGNPLDQLTVTTNQGDCLQEIEPGDEWLVYLFRDSKTNGLVLGYGSPSAPIAESTETIALLRRLSQMTNSGVIIGDVQDKLLQGDHHGLRWTEFLNVPSHQVVAKRLSDGIKYSALTDSAGHYEFQALPPGSYHLSANTYPGLWAEEGDTDVSKGSCTEIQFQLSPNGEISGHVTPADGKPLDLVLSVEIQSEDSHFSDSTFVNDQGYYQFRGLPPGRYLVGVGINAQRGTPQWRFRLYYPGVHSKKAAAIIDLGQAATRTGIDFSFARPSAPKDKRDGSDTIEPDHKTER